MKQNKMILVFVFMSMVICIATISGSCAANKQLTDKENMSNTNPEKPIHCRVGETFSIILDSNPSTGYQWRLANSSDGGLLKLIGSKYRASKIKLEGTGGKEIWSFEALSVAQKTIVFEYVRPCEEDKEPVKRMTFMVNIQ